MAIFSITLPVQATGHFAGDGVLAAQLGAHQQHKLDQIGRGLAQNSHRNGVAGLGQFVDGRRERGKIRTRRAVAQIDEFVHVGRAPDLAHLFREPRVGSSRS